MLSREGTRARAERGGGRDGGAGCFERGGGRASLPRCCPALGAPGARSSVGGGLLWRVRVFRSTCGLGRGDAHDYSVSEK